MVANYTRNARWWRKHKGLVIFGSLVAGSVLFSIRDVAEKGSQLSEIRQQVTNDNFNQVRIEATEELLIKQKEIANNRMRRGCIPIIDSKTRRSLTTIQEGKPVFDRKNNPIQSGTVCTPYGETAIIRKNPNGIPVMTDIVGNGDRELFYQNLTRIRGANVYFDTPTKGE